MADQTRCKWCSGPTVKAGKGYRGGKMYQRRLCKECKRMFEGETLIEGE